MKPAESFIIGQVSPEREIMQYLHEIFVTTGLQPRLRYGIPMYYAKRWVCYLNPLKTGGIELAFTRAHAFADPTGLLQARGRKMVKGMILNNLAAIDEKAIRAILAAALALDRS